MARKANIGAGRAFSIDLKSRAAVRTVSLGNGRGNGVAIEGSLGALERAGFLDGTVLEIAGTEGAIRVDLAREELDGPKTTPAKTERGADPK